MSRYYPDQAGSVVNRPGGSGSVIQDYGYADPDPEKYLQILNTAFKGLDYDRNFSIKET